MGRCSTKQSSCERRKGETEKAYEAFEIYLEMGADRSLGKVAGKLGKSKALMERWSRRNEWVSRARDYDAEIRRAMFQEEKKAAAKMRKRQIQTAVLMQKKALDAIDRLDPGEIPPRDIITLFKEAARIEKESRMEEAAEYMDVDSSGGTEGNLADAIMSAYEKRREEADAVE